LLTLLWALWNNRDPASFAPPKAGLVSTEVSDTTPHAYYYASGYRPSGKKAVRIDMLERLAGEIRRARDKGDRREGFEATSQMMSLVGCSGEDFEAILMSLNFRKNTVKRQVPIKIEDFKVKDSKQQTNEEDKPKSEATSNHSAATDVEILTPEPKAAEAPVEKPVETKKEITSPDIAPPDAEKPTLSDSQTIALPSADKKITATEEGAKTTTPAVDGQSSDKPAHADQTDDTLASPNDDVETKEIEVVLWRFQAKRPPRQHYKKDDGKNAKSGRHNDKNSGGKKSGKQFRQGDKSGQKSHHKKTQNPHMTKPRHLKTADPDSPFAVLAALKDGAKKSD